MSQHNTEALKQLVDNLRANADKQILGRLVSLQDDGTCKMCAEGVAVVTFAAMEGYDYDIVEYKGFHRFILSSALKNRAFEVVGSANQEINEYFFTEIPEFKVKDKVTYGLMQLNDHYELTFNQIADIIEEQYLK